MCIMFRDVGFRLYIIYRVSSKSVVLGIWGFRDFGFLFMDLIFFDALHRDGESDPVAGSACLHKARG